MRLKHKDGRFWLVHENNRVPLTLAESKIILRLTFSRYSSVSKMADVIYGNCIIPDWWNKCITVSICKLRAKMRQIGSPLTIRCHYNVGYFLEDARRSGKDCHDDRAKKIR